MPEESEEEGGHEERTTSSSNTSSSTNMSLGFLYPPGTSYRKLTKHMTERSLYLFSLNNPIRKISVQIIKSKLFDRIVLGLILGNCIFLALDSNQPHFADSVMGRVLIISEYFFTAAFVLEMCLKILGLGLAFGENTYLKDYWNVMDGMVVTLGLLAFLPSGVLPSVTAVRTVRVLRPLRTLTSVEGMRVLVVTILQTLPMMLNVLILMAFAFFIFGIIGVQMFAERMRNRCGVPVSIDLGLPVVENQTFVAIENVNWLIIDEEEEETLCSGPFAEKYPNRPSVTTGFGRECPNFNYVMEDGSEVEIPQWCVQYENPNYGFTNFDHIPYAFLTIFQIISLEGWTDIMYGLQDGVGHMVWMYFLLIVLFGAIFAVNLALAVLYVEFTKDMDSEETEEANKGEKEGVTPAEAEQNLNGFDNVNGSHDDTVKDLKGEGELERSDADQGKQEQEPTSAFQKLRHLCYIVQADNRFEVLTVFLITANTAIMATEYYQMPERLENIYEKLNYIFTGYFTIESIIKILGVGFWRFCSDSFNLFDGFVVILSIFEICMNAFAGGGNGFLSVFRSIRLLRVFKLARSWKELNGIITTMFASIASVSYLSLLLLLFTFIFALLGKQLFGYKFQFCEMYGEDSEPLCPPGEDEQKRCMKHNECYTPCDASQNNTWIDEDYGLCMAYPLGGAPLPEGQDDYVYLTRQGPAHVPRSNFDNFWFSVITVFQILTGENWNEVMYDAMRATSIFACVYFIMVTVIGNYVILNLFLAIVLDNFGNDNTEKEEKPAAHVLRNTVMVATDLFLSRIGGQTENKVQPITDGSEENSDEKDEAENNPNVEDEQAETEEGKTDAKKRWSSVFVKNQRKTTEDRINTIDFSAVPALPPPKRELKPSLDITSNTLYVFSPTNRFRMGCTWIVEHPFFEYSIITLILLTSILLAIDGPSLDHNGSLKKALDQIDKVVVVLFTLEMLIKLIVYGLLLHKGSYLRSSWNMLDFLVVMVGLYSWFGVEGEKTNAMRSLRTLRALRPIKLARGAQGMKVVVNALFESIPGIANVSFICLLFYLMFGILGVNMFKGVFHYCEDVDTGERVEAEWLFDLWLTPGQEPLPGYYAPNITKTWCQSNNSIHYIEYPEPSQRPPVMLETIWKNPDDYNFDNIGASIIALFEMATLEGWLDIMYSGMDATSDGTQPVRDHNVLMALFSMIYVVLGAFFVMNLFIGVSVDKFNELKAAQEGRSVFITDEQYIKWMRDNKKFPVAKGLSEGQATWMSIVKMVIEAKPLKSHVQPANRWRRKAFNIVTHDTFDVFIMTMIMVSVLFMTLAHADMTQIWEDIISIANIIFTIVFVLEAVLKNIALGPKVYISDGWNCFDGLVVCISVISLIITSAIKTDLPGVSLLRVLRVARIFRLIPRAKGLLTLFQTLYASIPAFANVGSVLLLLFLIFGIMGMNLFGMVKYGDFLNRHANFHDLGSSLLVLVRMSTGESWNGLMHDTMINTECFYISLDGHPLRGEYFSKDDVQLSHWVVTDPELEYPDNGFWGEPLDRYVMDEVENHCGPDSHGIISIIYFCVFTIMCALVMLNVLIAVILENFETFYKSANCAISPHDIQHFQDQWHKEDPQCTEFIPVDRVWTLMNNMYLPLGFKDSEMSDADMLVSLCSVPIKLYDGKVNFYELLHYRAKKVGYEELPYVEEMSIKQHLDQKFPPQSEEDDDSEQHTVGMHYWLANLKSQSTHSKLLQAALSEASRREVEQDNESDLPEEDDNSFKMVKKSPRNSEDLKRPSFVSSKVPPMQRLVSQLGRDEHILGLLRKKQGLPSIQHNKPAEPSGEDYAQTDPVASKLGPKSSGPIQLPPLEADSGVEKLKSLINGSTLVGDLGTSTSSSSSSKQPGVVNGGGGGSNAGGGVSGHLGPASSLLPLGTFSGQQRGAADAMARGCGIDRPSGQVQLEPLPHEVSLKATSGALHLEPLGHPSNSLVVSDVVQIYNPNSPGTQGSSLSSPRDNPNCHQLGNLDVLEKSLGIDKSKEHVGSKEQGDHEFESMAAEVMNMADQVSIFHVFDCQQLEKNNQAGQGGNLGVTGVGVTGMVVSEQQPKEDSARDAKQDAAGQKR